MKLLCDKQILIHVASNSVFQRELNILGLIIILFEKSFLYVIQTTYVNWVDQLVEMFTKSLEEPLWSLFNELDAYDIYAPSWGGVLIYYTFPI